MSCEGHRAKYFDHLAGHLEGGNAHHLEKLYQAASNQPNGDMAELAELKTRLLFGDMQTLGIKPPTHAANGLPKKKSQHGYAAIYDHLKQQGYFEKRKNGKTPRAARPVKPKVVQKQGETEKAPKAETRKEAHPVHEIAPERLQEITQQAQKGLSFVGLTEEETAEQVERFPIWQYLPRCGKCGRWMSTQNPVCQNPRCGLAGQQQGEPIPWPPEGANFKRSRVQASGISGLEDTDREPGISVTEPPLEGHEHDPARESPSLRADNASTHVKPEWVTAGQWITEKETGKNWWLASVDDNGSMNLSESPEALPMRATLLFDEYEPREEEPESSASEMNEEILDDLDSLADETLPTNTPTGHDYQITEADALGKGGAKTKARANVEAIKLIKQLEEEGRMATPDEQAILIKFVGWGGLPGVFDRRNEWYNPNASYGMYRDKPEFYDEYQELKQLLTPEEWNAASRSTVNAHYTSATVVKGVWDALQHMGYAQTHGTVLEPASGVGHFFGLMPEAFKGSNKVAVELDPFTARIAKQLYQNADVRNSGFEATTLPNDYFDLAISNVPFGNFPVVDKDFLGARRFLTRSIHNFFFAKALDKVKPGGTVAFITSRYTLDSKDDEIRKYLAEHADLVGALRLPNTAFKENAGTEVT
ncbi:MAG: class I SAM-dependent methyltransferase, partial [Anaerolineales bacterium]|nr:class I SAM-dependent methyltransferase [Anaerolineales bacterium]